jgi:hypothetical protein
VIGSVPVGDSFDIFGDPFALTLSEYPWAKARPDAE